MQTAGKIVLVTTSVFIVALYSQITIFVIPPVGAIPDGVTAIITRLPKTEFIDSADAMCERMQGRVDLLCRGVVLGEVAKKSTILLRFPFSASLHSISTGGKLYTSANPAEEKEQGSVKNDGCFNIDKITVRLSGAEHYLQASFCLMAAKVNDREMVSKSLPQLRSEITRVLSEKTLSQVTGASNMQLVADELKASVNDSLRGNATIDEVFFMSILTQ